MYLTSVNSGECTPEQEDLRAPVLPRRGLPSRAFFQSELTILTFLRNVPTALPPTTKGNRLFEAVLIQNRKE
jgi:hypothetical protein